MIGHKSLYQPEPPPIDPSRADGGGLHLRDEAIGTLSRATGCCYPEGSFDAVLDWMSENADSIWRQANRPAFGGSGDLRAMVEALRVSVR